MAKRDSWSGEEHLALVLPTDLFTASEDEASDSLNGSFTALPEGAGTAHVVALHGSVALACVVPWCFVFPLLASLGGDLRGLLMLSGGVTLYFSLAALATSVLLLLPSLYVRSHVMLGVCLGVKTLVSVLFGLVPALQSSTWAQAGLPLYAASGLIDGVLAHVASECILVPTTQDTPQGKAEGINDIFARLRNVTQDPFSTRLTEIIASLFGALLGYVSVVVLASHPTVERLAVFRIAPDTLPGLVVGPLALVVLMLFVAAKKPVLLPKAVTRRRRKVAEPRVRIPLLLMRLLDVFVPSASAAVAVLSQLSLVWLLVAELAFSTVGKVAGLALVIRFFSSGVWFVVISKMASPDNEVVKTAVTLLSLAAHTAAMVVIVVEKGGSESALVALLIACVLQCVQQEYASRTGATALFRQAGSAVGALASVIIALEFPFGSSVASDLVRLVAEIAMAVGLLLLLLLVLQMALFLSRRQELASYCVKASRSRAGAGAVMELLMAECRRELTALAAMGNLSAEDRETMKRFSPKDEDGSETHLRECVSELRMLRKRLAATK